MSKVEFVVAADNTLAPTCSTRHTIQKHTKVTTSCRIC